MTDRKDAGAEVGLKSSDLIGPRSFYHNRKDAGENGFREIKWAEHRWNTRIGIFFNTVKSKYFALMITGYKTPSKLPTPPRVKYNGGLLRTFPKAEILEEVS